MAEGYNMEHVMKVAKKDYLKRKNPTNDFNTG